MRRLCLALLVFCWGFSWLPAQSTPTDRGFNQTVIVDPQPLVSRLKLRLKTTGNGDIVIPASDMDLLFSELELVSNESLQNYSAVQVLQLENKKLEERLARNEQLKKAAPWICLVTFGAGVIAGCVGGYLVQK